LDAVAQRWSDGWYASADGLRLHWRQIGPVSALPALLCIPGLTRTARDFGHLERLAGRWRIIAVDLRGRGDSAVPRDVATYSGSTYVEDLKALLAAAGVGRFVALGSSIGGLLAIRLAAETGSAAGLVLNDIGPNIAPEGLARLRGNAGRQVSWPTWVHTARDLGQRNADIYPSWGLVEWLAFAKRLCRVSASGRIVFDYDPRIAEPFRVIEGDPAAASWAALASLANLPVLSLRAERSDVLTPQTQAAMAAKLPRMMVAQVPGIGHAPTLMEPAAVAALDRFLQEITGEALTC
jgi:pimeloyl-ACP methyl ester carboxylesterase